MLAATTRWLAAATRGIGCHLGNVLIYFFRFIGIRPPHFWGCPLFKEIPTRAESGSDDGEYGNAKQQLREQYVLTGHFVGVELERRDTHDGQCAKKSNHGADAREPGESHVLV